MAPGPRWPPDRMERLEDLRSQDAGGLNHNVYESIRVFSRGPEAGSLENALSDHAIRCAGFLMAKNDCLMTKTTAFAAAVKPVPEAVGFKSGCAGKLWNAGAIAQGSHRGGGWSWAVRYGSVVLVLR